MLIWWRMSTINRFMMNQMLKLMWKLSGYLASEGEKENGVQTQLSGGICVHPKDYCNIKAFGQTQAPRIQILDGRNDCRLWKEVSWWIRKWSRKLIIYNDIFRHYWPWLIIKLKKSFKPPQDFVLENDFLLTGNWRSQQNESITFRIMVTGGFLST